MTQSPPKPALSAFSEEALSRYSLGNDSMDLSLATREDNQKMAVALLSQARRSLEIFTPDLEAEIYDQPAFLEALKVLVLQSRHVRVRILLRDASAVIRDGHRLVEMMRRLTSYIEIREPNADYHDHNEAFMIVDGCGLLFRRLGGRYEGMASFNNPLQARGLGNLFDEIWQRSHPHTELRRVHL